MATETIQPVKQHKKSNHATMQERVNIVLELILIGYSRYMICQYASKTWGVVARQADRYIEAANQSIDINIDKERDRIKKENIERRIRIIRQAEKTGDYHLARLTISDLDKVLGNYPSDKLNITGNINTTINEAQVIEEAKKRGMVIPEILLERSQINISAVVPGNGDNGNGKHK